MGKNARGQIVAVARLLPSGIGKVLSATGKHTLFNLRREVAAYDFTDGTRQAFKKSSGGWVDDTLLEMQVHTCAASDELYDTDAPDLPAGAQTAETYNNFRQWLEWDRRPCSNYANWYWQARWKDQQVTLSHIVEVRLFLLKRPAGGTTDGKSAVSKEMMRRGLNHIQVYHSTAAPCVQARRLP